MKQLFLLTILGLFLTTGSAFAQFTGKWKTIDDNTGKVKSIVEITESNGVYTGTVVQLFRGADEDQDPDCTECKGNKKGQKIIGLEIVYDMTKDGDELSSGKIMDPENGKEYRCKMWREGEDLKVRGYIAFLYRTQTWKKVD